MPYLIGTDEAGYGPNLGPLVIAASAWHVSCDPHDCDLYELLQGVVAKSAAVAVQSNLLAVADSKALYKPGQGLRLLERGVLSAVAMLGHRVPTAKSLWRALGACDIEAFDSLPWDEANELALPIHLDPAEADATVRHLSDGCKNASVRLVALRACAVFPERFNRLVDDCGSKGEALSKLTLGLLGDMLDRCDDEPISIVCDKHGGRGKYQRLLQEQFPDLLIEVLREGLAESAYRWGPPTRRVEICFRAKGESFLPAALASMTAKYLRELAMHEFNAFWQARVDGLRPTAGYPLDAKRFKQEIASVQASLGIEDDRLWRRK